VVPKQSRLDTMRLIIGRDNIMKNSPMLPIIYGELALIADASRSQYDKKWLLAVLYTTRALDTCLSEIITYMGWPLANDKKNLRAYFSVLATHHVLTSKENTDYRKTLVYPRNTYLHRAGTTPTKLQADTIINETHSCLAIVLQNT
jgi:hypothetical protein